MSRRFAVFAFGILLVAFLAYFLFSFQDFLRGPQVRIDSPNEGEFLNNSHILVAGQSKDVAKLEINGRPIYTDESGNFEEDLILSAGLNIIEIKAEGRFGGEIREQRMVMVRMPN